MTNKQYISCYFDQSGEALDFIDEHGVDVWLDMLDGAIDFTEGETSDCFPWGLQDELIHREEHVTAQDGVLSVHVNRSIGYVSVTLAILVED
jgi:hypothetical protein